MLDWKELDKCVTDLATRRLLGLYCLRTSSNLTIVSPVSIMSSMTRTFCTEQVNSYSQDSKLNDPNEPNTSKENQRAGLDYTVMKQDLQMAQYTEMIFKATNTFSKI